MQHVAQLDVIFNLAFIVLQTMARHSSGLLLSSDSHSWNSRHSESCFAHLFTWWAHQLVHAAEESGHQRVLRDVIQRDSRIES